MKKRFLSILTALCLALSLLPATALATEDTGVECSDPNCTHVAETNGKHYNSLAAAVGALLNSSERSGTVKLRKDSTGSGIGLFNAQGHTNVSLTIDFGGHTYSLEDPSVGSPGYESQGFHLEQGNTVVLKNGKIDVASGNTGIAMLIQNYADLTLTDLNVDGSGMTRTGTYALSNNNGSVLINGNTSITAKEGDVAFDVCRYSNYPKVDVTVDTTGTISGKIEMSASDSDVKEGCSLTIKNGIFEGEFDKQTSASAGTISITGGTFSSDVTDYLPSGMTQVKGEVVVDTAKAVAKVNGVGYDDLQEAINAAGKGDTVTLLQDEEQDVTIAAGQEITLDLGTYTLKNANGHTITNNGTLTIIGSGTVDNVTHAKGALVNYGTATLKGGTFTRSAENGISPSNNGGNSWYVIDNHGTMTIDGATVTSTGKYSSLIRNIKANENEDGVLNVVSGNLHNGFITLKNDTAGRLNVTGGTITSDNQAIQNWNEATISGGELTGLVYSWSAGADGSAEAGTLTISGNAKITGNVYAVQYKYDNIEPTKAATVKIEGGTIIGTVSTATSGYGTGESPTTSANMTVSGGNFSSSVREEFLAEELTAELYSTSKNSQAPYSYYVSVSAALEDAKAGDTVVDLTAQQGTEKYTVTLRYGNGEADTTYTELAAGTTLALPTPTRTDYRFDGWYVNGTRYTNSYPVSGNVTLVAQWTYVGSSSGSSSDPSYSPILDVSDGGSIKINPRTPEEDDEVTITVDPDSGYEVDEVTVTDRNGREVKVTAERDGTYTFTQPRGRVTISVTFVREGGSTFFSDVPESFWAYDEIAWAYDNGYVNGTSASAFSPNASISRQQVWMILARLSGADPANMSAAREWAVTNGVSDGTTPGGAVTRQQLVALLYRYATLMGYANDQRADLSAYPDAGTVAGYAVEPMQWSVANSIVGGTSNGTLDPTGTATRAQFAVILYRFWDQVG